MLLLLVYKVVQIFFLLLFTIFLGVYQIWCTSSTWRPPARAMLIQDTHPALGPSPPPPSLDSCFTCTCSQQAGEAPHQTKMRSSSVQVAFRSLPVS